MKIKRLDHVVLTVSNLPKAERFYHEVFDMPVIEEQSNDEVITLRFGHQLLRLRQQESNETLQAANPSLGAADFSIVAGDKLEDIQNHLKSYFIPVVAGPVEKMGAEGKMTSIFIHDLDKNLIEISVY